MNLNQNNGVDDFIESCMAQTQWRLTSQNMSYYVGPPKVRTVGGGDGETAAGCKMMDEKELQTHGCDGEGGGG